MRLAAVPGVTPVSLRSVQHTTAELLTVLARLRDATDPTLNAAAVHAAELAHDRNAGLVAVVEHPAADPAILVAGVVQLDRPVKPDAAAELGYHLADGPGISEVTHAETARGYPVVIAERIPVTQAGTQLQAVVIDPASPRIAVFTLHSPTGRGWLDLASVAGRLVTSVEFTEVGSARVP